MLFEHLKGVGSLEKLVALKRCEDVLFLVLEALRFSGGGSSLRSDVGG